ncbi:MAG TPA: hypothetical protein DEB44_06400 [Acidimicrobiaceae bacterium]|nr:hypothetical protein [Acidimicrobiaceae bacterium]
MASKISIDPAALKRNLDLIIAGFVAIVLVAYGYMEYDESKVAREKSNEDLQRETQTYNGVKEVSVPENFGLTNSTSISTDRSHGNQALAEKTHLAINNHLSKVYSKFAPLDIPDGVVVDPSTGAILSVALMTGGDSYTSADIDTLEAKVYDLLEKGKGAVLKPQLRSLGGDTPDQYRVETIQVVNGGAGYTKGKVMVVIEGGSGGGGSFDSGPPSEIDQTGGPGPVGSEQPGMVPGVPPGMGPGMGMAPGMGMGMGMMANSSMGAGGDESVARVGLDDNTFLEFMHTKVYGLQRQCKNQRIRLPKFEEEDKEFVFSFSKAWNEPEFKSHEREIMAYQLAEIEALCQALFKANIHEIYNIRRLKIMRGGEGGQMSEEDLLEYLPDAKFKLDDVKKFVGEAPGSRVMPYEVTFRGFSSELSIALEELYKSSVFFVVKNIAVIEATGVVDDFEEEEDEMSLGGGGGRSMREGYGPMGMGRGGMPGYGTMPFGMQGLGFGAGEERKRKRPPSLLLDESPLKVTLRVNSIKRVDPSKDSADAFAALENAIELANTEEEEGSDDDLIGVDEDGDGFDAYDEKITGHSDNDPDDKPTQEEVDAALAELEE